MYAFQPSAISHQPSAISQNDRIARRGFTLVELIATIAILGIVVAISIPFIADYVTQARQTADRQTLEVLNDAINRYKMQGGDLSTLTVGKPYSNLLSTLRTPVSWNGLDHQFLRGGGAYEQATTIAATGSGRSYRLTGMNSYMSEAGSELESGPPPVVATDDFNRADSSDLGSEWISLGGDDAIISTAAFLNQ